MARNALKQADRSLAETVLPFDMKKLRPFQAGYFLGFRAERRDREKEEFTQEIEQEIKQYTRESLQNSVSGYDHVDIRNHRETITGEKCVDDDLSGSEERSDVLFCDEWGKWKGLRRPAG